jgi:hypothetical protein
MLPIWPPLPIVIRHSQFWRTPPLATENVDNIVAAFGHRNRVYEIDLDPLPLYLFEWIAPIMQESFPTLEVLTLRFQVEPAMIFPDSFLVGCAPRLRKLVFHGVPFPGLPKLLWSTNNLVELCLENIPYSGYISPEAMVTCLSSSINLRTLLLDFSESESLPDDFNTSLSSSTRVDLPSLLDFRFNGSRGYVEDFVARINAPLLRVIEISVFHEPLFDTTQLIRFIGRITGFGVLHRAYMAFYHGAGFIRFENTVHNTSFELQIECTGLEAQLSSLAQFCGPLASSILRSMEYLEVMKDSSPADSRNNRTEDTSWLWSRLLQPFAAVRDLYLPRALVFSVVRAMQDRNRVGSEELLPALRNIFVLVLGSPPSSDVQEAIRSFTAARKDSGHPVAIRRWEQCQEDGDPELQ